MESEEAGPPKEPWAAQNPRWPIHRRSSIRSTRARRPPGDPQRDPGRSVCVLVGREGLEKPRSPPAFSFWFPRIVHFFFLCGVCFLSQRCLNQQLHCIVFQLFHGFPSCPFCLCAGWPRGLDKSGVLSSNKNPSDFVFLCRECLKKSLEMHNPRGPPGPPRTAPGRSGSQSGEK